MAPCDIAVAGAGPAGLAMALALHRAGHRVVIYEQFSEPKPLGSGLILQPTGLGVLDWLGLGARIRNLGARIDRLTGKSSGTLRTVLDVSYDAIGDARGYAVHRAALFNVLHDAVTSAGIAIETNARVEALSDGRLTLQTGQRTPAFDLVIDALGSHSPLAQSDRRARPLAYGALWATLPWPGGTFDPHALEQRYERAAVMIGVLPIGQQIEGAPRQVAFFWSLKAQDLAAWHSNGLDAWKDTVRRHWPETDSLLASITTADDLTFARYQHHTLHRPYGERLVHIGDAAHATSPQLGQGANNALLDVRALANALEQYGDVAEAARSYARSRRLHVRTYQALSLVFTPFYQSDSRILPFVRDTFVAQASRVAPARRLLARMVAGTVVTPITG